MPNSKYPVSPPDKPRRSGTYPATIILSTVRDKKSMSIRRKAVLDFKRNLDGLTQCSMVDIFFDLAPATNMAPISAIIMRVYVFAWIPIASRLRRAVQKNRIQNHGIRKQ